MDTIKELLKGNRKWYALGAVIAVIGLLMFFGVDVTAVAE